MVLTAGVVILVTGMSGTGKSTVLAELARRGHRVVDTDYRGWSREVPLTDGPGFDQLWREERIQELLDGHSNGALFISGTVSNQGLFYPRFDAVVLLSAPVEVLLARVASRKTNDYGKTVAQRDQIERYVSTVEPLLRTSATVEIDTRQPVAQVADELERVAGALRGPPDPS
jgi:dephospho-CoA kinase